jgi:hypothetical protein
MSRGRASNAKVVGRERSRYNCLGRKSNSFANEARMR